VAKTAKRERGKRGERRAAHTTRNNSTCEKPHPKNNNNTRTKENPSLVDVRTPARPKVNHYTDKKYISKIASSTLGYVEILHNGAIGNKKFEKGS
jgi:hypothetical protein